MTKLKTIRRAIEQAPNGLSIVASDHDALLQAVLEVAAERERARAFEAHKKAWRESLLYFAWMLDEMADMHDGEYEWPASEKSWHEKVAEEFRAIAYLLRDTEWETAGEDILGWEHIAPEHLDLDMQDDILSLLSEPIRAGA